MSGEEIFKRDISSYSRYARFLMTLYLHLDEDELYPLLEKAERLGMILAWSNKPIDPNKMDGDVTLDAVCMVNK